MPDSSRFIIGLDLGTTNCAVSYVDTSLGGDIHAFGLPQLVAAGEVAERSLLPSFLYLPAGHELPPGALALPWRQTGDDAIGVFARDQGALVPDRLVSSAKSWLAHAGVDREAAILPWGGELAEQAVSPVAATRCYLEHIRHAWDHRFGAERDEAGTPCLMAEQTVVVTVPASFDEVARELTLSAAKQAGLGHAILLEEPLAAFYGWLAGRETTWRETIAEDETVLVVDVGGGTSDFSLIDVAQASNLRRTAVGDHLLLGGDNIDMALARDVEATWGGKLCHREWSLLCHQCRMAKEDLLRPGGGETFQVAVAGAGRGLVASTRTATINRAGVIERLLDGFFPFVAPAAALPGKGGGMRQMGLPYVADPAVTRHLAAFLQTAANVAPAARVARGFASPSRVLFNGGSLLPEIVRRRIREAIGHLTADTPPDELTAADLSRAVSVGAAYYGMVRRGQGVRVKGGIARAYFLEVEVATESRYLCIMPRDREEGDTVALAQPRFNLATNQAVRFNLFSSSTRIGDRPGEVLDEPDGLTRLPPLTTVVRYGRGEHGHAPVVVEAMLNEVGTLDLACVTLDGHHRFPLSFNLRSEAAGESAGRLERVVDEAAIKRAGAAITAAFEPGGDLPGLYNELERCLALPRADWGASLARRLADGLLRNPHGRLSTPRHEARWLNLVGYLLRPGYGVAGDETRLASVWKLWHGGLAHPGKPQVTAEWWIFWRRLAGGLREGHQQQMGGVLFKEVTGQGGMAILTAKGASGHVLREQWRCLAALERLPVKRKAALLRKLCDAPSREPHFFWALARLAARQLLHGPENCVLPADKLTPALTLLLAERPPEDAQARRLFALALAALCAPCAPRNLDVGDEIRDQAIQAVRDIGQDELAERLRTGGARSRAENEELLGDSLPLGLRLAERAS